MADRQLNIKPSSNVDAAFFDPETQQIRCVFHSKHEGVYSGCGEDVATAFEQAESSGKFVATVLKPQYPYQKIG